MFALNATNGNNVAKLIASQSVLENAKLIVTDPVYRNKNCIGFVSEELWIESAMAIIAELEPTWSGKPQYTWYETRGAEVSLDGSGHDVKVLVECKIKSGEIFDVEVVASIAIDEHMDKQVSASLEKMSDKMFVSIGETHTLHFSVQQLIDYVGEIVAIDEITSHHLLVAATKHVKQNPEVFKR
ncbi:hypothetical protein [Vibrio barjaei]|uniref:hypothetical protein n=1 Tax=Vibrio barjaei TaxID=1676683 RepID=UPI002283EF7F|nr:hypothetical protein [Vibrio barjaei]MCY9870389.1 hypothetical protein [Vibrio barjaei]